MYRLDEDEAGRVIGRTLVEEGPIWLVERPIETIHTITPITQHGTWDASLKLNLEDWAGNYGVLPDGEHDNILEFASLSVLQSFMQRDLVLTYKWLPQLKLRRRVQARTGMGCQTSATVTSGLCIGIGCGKTKM